MIGLEANHPICAADAASRPRRGFVRYADDGNIDVRSRRAGERVMASVTSFVTRRLQLRVNTAKSAATPCPGVPEPAGRLGVGDQDRMGTPGVDHPSRLEFLGFGFTAGKAPPQRGCGDPPEPSGAAPRGTAHRAAGAGPARDAGPGADAADQRGLARADDPRPGGPGGERLAHLPHRVAGLFRLLPDAVGPPHGLGIPTRS